MILCDFFGRARALKRFTAGKSARSTRWRWHILMSQIGPFAYLVWAYGLSLLSMVLNWAILQMASANKRGNKKEQDYVSSPDFARFPAGYGDNQNEFLTDPVMGSGLATGPGRVS